MTNDEATKLVDDAAARLHEHFDCVVILTSRDHPDMDRVSTMIVRGRGNWFAQRGMMRNVLDEDQARSIAVEIKLQSREE